MIITANMNGGHSDRGDPGGSCRCGGKVVLYLDVKHPEGFDDPEGQAKDQEAGEQDEPGVATVRGCGQRHGRPNLLRLRWRVHGDLRWFLPDSDV